VGVAKKWPSLTVGPDKNAGQSGHTRPKRTARPGRPVWPMKKNRPIDSPPQLLLLLYVCVLCRPTPQRAMSIHYVMHAAHVLSIWCFIYFNHQPSSVAVPLPCSLPERHLEA